VFLQLISCPRIDPDPDHRIAGLDPAHERVGSDRKGQYEGERGVVESEGAVGPIPAGGVIILGVDQQSDAAHLVGDADATIGGP
jgi:hypothetical protein